MKIIAALFLILFLMGCSTETIEIGPEDNASNETEDTEPPETSPAPAAPAVNATVNTTPVATVPAIVTHTVKVTENKFTPNTLTIKVGEMVIWENAKAPGKKSSQTSLLGVRGICGNKKLISEDFAPGETFNYTFNEAGECPYIDIYYTNNAGKIIVE